LDAGYTKSRETQMDAGKHEKVRHTGH